ncbi:MAG: type II secretion system F family protein [Candidatus Aenigmatarchaeota archaeon]
MAEIFKRIGAKMPSSYIKFSGKYLEYIRAKSTPEEYVGKVLVYSLLIAFIVSTLLFIFNLSIFYILLGFLVSFFLVHILPLFFLILIADDRARELEANFPDVLSLISANLRAGMTVEKAIWSAARPEFGPLEEELNDVGKDVVGGVPITEALLKMAKRIRSEIITQTIKLIIEGIKSGGELESLLSEIANDIRAMDMLKEEVKANLTMYTIFIFFAACIAAPLIYGISSKFVEISVKIQRPIISESVAGAPIYLGIRSGMISVTEPEIFFFYISLITIITIFASFIYGIMTSGRMRRGLRYTPLFFIVGLAIFILTKFLINQIFLI